MSQWLDPELWAATQRSIPIFCVDVMAVRRTEGGRLQLGLILRETPHQGRRWCLIGGRVRYLERLSSAVEREVASALITDLAELRLATTEPLLVEYLPNAPTGQLHDPRKHAIAATYAAWLGDVESVIGAEALDFKWFDPEDATIEVMGFGQHTLVSPLLALATSK